MFISPWKSGIWLGKRKEKIKRTDEEDKIRLKRIELENIRRIWKEEKKEEELTFCSAEQWAAIVDLGQKMWVALFLFFKLNMNLLKY